MSKRPQAVSIQIHHPDQTNIISMPVEGTNTGNLMSKIQKAVRLALIQNVTEFGMEITVKIEPAGPDEFANPDR